MSEIIKDPENIKEDINFKLKSSKEAFQLEKKSFIYIGKDGKAKTVSYKQFLENIQDNYATGRYDLAAFNSINVLGYLPNSLNENMKRFEENVQSFLSILSDYYNTVLRNNEEIKELKKEIQEKDQHIDQLRESLEQERENTKNREIEKVNENMSNMVNLVKGVVSQQSVPAQPQPKTEEADYSEESNNVDIQKEIHDEIIYFLDADDVTPLHKNENIEQVKEQYKEYWRKLSNDYGVDENGYPEFIEKLEQYTDYPPETEEIEGYKVQ